MKIYDTYMSVIGNENNFTNEEKEKILYNIVKNFSIEGDRYYLKKEKSASKERCSGKDEYLLYIHINNKLHYMECSEQEDENKKCKYYITIEVDGISNVFGSEKFNELFKYF